MKYENGRVPKVEPCALEMLNSNPPDKTAANLLDSILDFRVETSSETYGCARCPAQLVLHASGIIGNSLECGQLQAKLAERCT